MGITVIEANVSTVRSKVYPGQGNMDKERAGALIRSRFPEHEFANLDETDASMLALAGPALLL
jgi:hypothetical protein